MKKLIVLLILAVTFTSCELLESVSTNGGNADIAAGLKEALTVGAQFASDELSAEAGYFGDPVYKILMPDEIQTAIDGFKAIEINVFGLGTITGDDLYSTGSSFLGIKSLQDIEDDLVLGINRAAEEAASEAFPIFGNAITGITFADANEILFGGVDNAATLYLMDNTFDELFTTYEPKISSAISVVQIGGSSVEDLYTDYVTEYNDILSTSIPTGLFSSVSLGDLVGLDEIEEVDLSDFATEEGLNGLFARVEIEEANIRNNAAARITDLLAEVFGQLD